MSSACFNEYYICTLKHALDKDSKNMGSSIAIDNFLNYSTMLKSLSIIKLEVIINYNEPVHQNQVKYDKRHAMDKDCKNLNSCCKLELENIFISCFNNSSLHYWVTFEKNIFFSHPLVLSERKFLLSRENSTKSTAVSCFCHMKQLWTWCCFHG